MGVLIITNADDFGMDAETVEATIECLECNALTSATIMPNMPATSMAADYAKNHPEKSFGVHLTWVTDTVEAPISDPTNLPTLTTPAGRFLDSRTMRLRALQRRVSVAEIERETAAQIQRLLDLGVRISHVDSHGHLHKFAPFLQALQRVLPRFGITKVRTAQNVYLTNNYKSPTFWFGKWWRKRIMNRFVTTDDLFMPRSRFSDVSWPKQLVERVTSSKTIEVCVHPGRSEPWRDAERRAIQDFAVAARAAGHRFINWHELGA